MSHRHQCGTTQEWRDKGAYRYRIVESAAVAQATDWIAAGDFQYRVVPVPLQSQSQAPPQTVPTQPPQPPSSAFAEIAVRHEAQKMRLKYLRRSFQYHSPRLARDIAAIYTRYQDKGTFRGIDVRETELAAMFRAGLKTPFSNAGLEKFPGKYKGVNRHWMVQPDKTIQEVTADASTWYMTWEKGQTSDDGTYVQRVVGSTFGSFESGSLPPLSDKKVDLALNVYAPDIGITGWLSQWIQARTEMALISYEIHPGEFMWIAQMLDGDLNPIAGDKSFWIFLEWIRPEERAYYMYGVLLNIDFDNTEIQLQEQGFRKSKFERID